jgi:hypothetical protein
MNHTISYNLKDLITTDVISVDDWKIHEWEMLNDLGFEHDGALKMRFEYDEMINGEKKKISIQVWKKRDGWHLLTTFNKLHPKEEIYKGHSRLMNRIHELFDKF